jgi:hypothetical protein
MLRCNKRWSSRPVLGEHRAGDDRLQSFGAIEGVVIGERLRVYHLTRRRWAAERTEHPRYVQGGIGPRHGALKVVAKLFAAS